MTVTDRLARFNRRGPNRVIGMIAGRRLSPVAYMLHQGRKSGRQYRTPVMPLPLATGSWSRCRTVPTATGSATSWPPAAAPSCAAGAGSS
jgi:hypothetical protein